LKRGKGQMQAVLPSGVAMAHFALLVIDKYASYVRNQVLHSAGLCLSDKLLVDALQKRRLKRMREIADGLFHEKLLVVIMGRVKAGKSTFVNCLLRAKEAPVGATPETRCLMLYKHPLGSEVDIAYDDGIEEKVPKDAALSIVHDEHNRIKQATFHCNLGIYEQVTIVDTPGLESPNALHNQISRRYISKSDIVFWVLVPRDIGLKMDLQYLKHCKYVIGVVNQMDRALKTEKRSREDMINHLREQLTKDGMTRCARSWHFLSAKNAFAALENHDKSLLYNSGFLEIEAEIKQTILPQAALLKAHFAGTRLQNELMKAYKSVNRSRSHLEKIFSKYNNDRERIMTTAQNLQKQLQEEVEGRVQYLTKSVAERKAVGMSGLRSTLETGIELMRQSSDAKHQLRIAHDKLRQIFDVKHAVSVWQKLLSRLSNRSEDQWFKLCEELEIDVSRQIALASGLSSPSLSNAIGIAVNRLRESVGYHGKHSLWDWLFGGRTKFEQQFALALQALEDSWHNTSDCTKAECIEEGHSLIRQLWKETLESLADKFRCDCMDPSSVCERLDYCDRVAERLSELSCELRINASLEKWIMRIFEVAQVKYNYY